MSLSATTTGPDLLPSSRLSGRPEPGHGLYRAISLMTIFAMLFGGLLLMTPMSASAASATTTARLNLRSGPGLEHEVLAVIPQGASISVDGEAQAGYYPVTWSGTSGFAAADFIQIGGTADTGDTSGGSGDVVSDGAPTGTAWVTVSRLNFRSGPSTSDGVISVLAEGTAVELTGQQANGYWQATANGTTGWLYAQYLTTNGAPTTPNTGTDTGSDSGGGSSVPVGGSVTGTATVDANLNLRLGPSTSYAVVTVLQAGSTVELRGAPDGEYYPVAQNGTTGWAHGGWLTIGGSAPAPQPEQPDSDTGNGSVGVGDSVTGTATIMSNLNLRSGPSTSYSVVTVLPQGATVELRGEAQGEFLPLSYNGMTGWAHRNWVDVGSTSAPDPAPAPDTGNGAVPVGDAVSGTATVTANLNLRQGPSTDYAVTTVLRQGSTVEVRGAAQGEYYPVSQNGTSGWAHGGWLDIGASTPDPEPEPAPGDDGVPVGDDVTGTAVATANLNLRSGPSPVSYGVIAVIPQGATVEIRGGLNNGYYPVVYNGIEGWAASGWLQLGGSAPAPAPGDGSTPDYLYTTVAQNMRSQPTTNSAVVWVIPPGTRLEVTGAPQNGWYPVRWAHVSGWMLGDYLGGSYEPPVDSSDQWIVDIIYAAADRYGQPRADMLRVAECESHLDPNAVNPISGTSGLFQFRPGTWATTPYAGQDIFDPVANANAAAWMWSVGRRNEWACQ